MDRVNPVSSVDLFNEGCKANDHIIQVAVEIVSKNEDFC
jgi:hypothetical protein